MQSLGRDWGTTEIPASTSGELSTRYEVSISWRTSSGPQGLACLDDTFPALGRAALVGAWLGLQNTDESADSISSYVPVRPDAFLDAAELPVDALGASPRYDLLSALLVNKRTHPAVQAALEIRLPRCLGRWSQMATGQFLRGETPDKEAMRKARIEANLASLSEPERVRFRELTVEVSDYGALRLDWLAASLLAGRELKSIVAGLLGWALGRSEEHTSELQSLRHLVCRL